MKITKIIAQMMGEGVDLDIVQDKVVELQFQFPDDKRLPDISKLVRAVTAMSQGNQAGYENFGS